MAEKRPDRSHESTWGVSEAIKEQWETENGESVRKSTEKENTKRGKAAKDA